MPKPARLSAGLIVGLLLATKAMGFGTDLSGDIRPDDVARLEQLDSVAGHSLRRALASGSASDLQVLIEGLSGAALPSAEASSVLPGDWSCRMLKLGRDLALVVYAPFTCRIDPDGGFAKLTGSQRSQGRIGVIDDRLVYLGTAYVAGDTPPDYAQLPERVDPMATPQVVPDVGIVEVMSPDRARMLLPLPHLESDLNILLLSR